MKTLKILIVIVYMTFAVTAAAQSDLADYLPADAIAYLETGDLQSMLQQLDSSGFLASYTSTEAYKMFSNSKLALKLTDRLRALEENTGFGLNYDRLKNLAGSESALAIYDIGELRMTFITRLGQERVSQSSLWPLRESFDTRKSDQDGTEYYVKEDPYGRASLAFAFIHDLLIISTDIIRFEQTLELISGGTSTLRQDEAYAAASARWQGDGLLRLYLNQESIRETPYFSSYWVYGNQSSLENINWAAIEVVVQDDRLVERRHLNTGSELNTVDQSWVNGLGRSPILLSVGELSADKAETALLPVFSGSLSSSRKALTAALQGASPKSLATIIERPASQALAVTYAIQLGNPEAFDTAAFENAMAEAMKKALLPNFARAPEFVDMGEYRTLELPLLEEQLPAYRLDGEVLLIQPRRYLPAAAISRFSAIPGGATRYGFVDLGVMRTVFEQLSGELADLQVWSYTNGKTVVGEVIPALLKATSPVSWIEKQVVSDGGGFSEVVTYHLLK